MSKRPPSDAQRRAWARYRQTQATRPYPTVSLLRDEHVDQCLVGRRFIHQALGLLVAYEASVQGDDGRLRYSLTIVDAGRHGFRIGSVLVWPADRTRRADGE